jgi:hypothetical protein
VHPRIPEDSRRIREIDVLRRIAEQDRPAVEEEAHGGKERKGCASPCCRPLLLQLLLAEHAEAGRPVEMRYDVGDLRRALGVK